MTTQEAMDIIKKDFMGRYYEWRKDLAELSEHDFGWKYGWLPTERFKNSKDNLSAVCTFQKYFYPVRTTAAFKKMGIDEWTVWALAREAWLSILERSHEPTRYYISQKNAKLIWKEANGKI